MYSKYVRSVVTEDISTPEQRIDPGASHQSDLSSYAGTS